MEVVIKKDRFKFSAAHMTVFPNGTKESLHGHNFQVSLRVGLREVRFEEMIDFSVFKQGLDPLCQAWDEKVLVAAKNPLSHWKKSGTEFEWTLCGKRYVFPVDEVVVLDTDNVTTESLAGLMLKGLLSKLPTEMLTHLELQVEESPGQGAVARWASGLGSDRP